MEKERKEEERKQKLKDERRKAIEEQRMKEEQERIRQDERQLNVNQSLSIQEFADSAENSKKDSTFENETEEFDGDSDLKPYLDPLLQNIGSGKINFSENVPNGAFGDSTL